jgi:hypothetical protein
MFHFHHSGPTKGIWGEWSEFSTCIGTCGSGNQTRTRACFDPNTSLSVDDCPNFEEDSLQSIPCTLDPCKFRFSGYYH